MGSYFIIINNISLVGWNTHGLLSGISVTCKSVRGGRMVGNSVQSQRHFSSVLNIWYNLVQN
jgi:hypothetical protein